MATNCQLSARYETSLPGNERLNDKNRTHLKGIGKKIWQFLVVLQKLGEVLHQHLCFGRSVSRRVYTLQLVAKVHNLRCHKIDSFVEGFEMTECCLQCTRAICMIWYKHTNCRLSHKLCKFTPLIINPVPSLYLVVFVQIGHSHPVRLLLFHAVGFESVDLL